MISEKFFETYINFVYWKNLSANKNVSAEFFERHINNVDWDMISFNKFLGYEFYNKYHDKFNWTNLSVNHNIGEDLYEKHLNKVQWDLLLVNPNVSLKFHNKYPGVVPGTITYLSNNRSMKEPFFREYINNGINWNTACENFNLSEQFFYDYPEKIIWNSLCKNNDNTLFSFKKNKVSKNICFFETNINTE